MPEPNSITVDILLPLAAECWACSVVYYLEDVRVEDIVAMAERRWTCDCCREVCACSPESY